MASMNNFEKRGVTIKLIRVVRDFAKIKFIDEELCSIGRVCSLVVGNHEILRAPCRWGDNIDPNSTLTYSDRCSLIDLLERKYPNAGCKHPQLGVLIN